MFDLHIDTSCSIFIIDTTFHFCVYKRDAASLKMLTVDDMKSLFACINMIGYGGHKNNPGNKTLVNRMRSEKDFNDFPYQIK